MNHRLILLVLWLSAATTPAMANDHNGGNGRNACPAGTILHVIYIGGFVRRACVSWALLISRHVPGTSGNPGRGVQDGDGGIDHDAPLPSPVPAFSGDLNVDANKAIRNCAKYGSSVAASVDRWAAENGWSITLRYTAIPPYKGKKVAGEFIRHPASKTLEILVDPKLHVDKKGKPDWGDMAMTLLHEYHHAKDAIACDCAPTTAETVVEERARTSYLDLYDRPAPGADNYNEEHRFFSPPCE